MSDFNYEVKENLGVIAERPTGWTKELNLVSWCGANPKYDVREWAPDHDRMSRGLTFDEEEAYRLMELLATHFDMILLEREYDEEE